MFLTSDYRFKALIVLWFIGLMALCPMAGANCLEDVEALGRSSGLSVLIRELAQMAISLEKFDEGQPGRTLLSGLFETKSSEMTQFIEDLGLSLDEKRVLKQAYSQEVLLLRDFEKLSDEEREKIERQIREEEEALLTYFFPVDHLSHNGSMDENIFRFSLEFGGRGRYHNIKWSKSHQNDGFREETSIEESELSSGRGREFINIKLGKNQSFYGKPFISPLGDTVIIIKSQKYDDESWRLDYFLESWDVKTFERQNTVPLSAESPLGGLMQWSPDGRFFLAPHVDGSSTTLYDKNLKELKTFKSDIRRGARVEFSTDGHYFAVTDNGGTLGKSEIWKIDANFEVTRLVLQLPANFDGRSQFLKYHFDLDRGQIITRNSAERIDVWDLKTGNFIRNIPLPVDEKWTSSLQFASHDLMLIDFFRKDEELAKTLGHRAVVLNSETLKYEEIVLPENEFQRTISISPDGRWVAIVSMLRGKFFLTVRSLRVQMDNLRYSFPVSVNKSEGVEFIYPPIWSPDSHYVTLKMGKATYSFGKGLRK